MDVTEVDRASFRFLNARRVLLELKGSRQVVWTRVSVWISERTKKKISQPDRNGGPLSMTHPRNASGDRRLEELHWTGFRMTRLAFGNGEVSLVFPRGVVRSGVGGNDRLRSTGPPRLGRQLIGTRQNLLTGGGALSPVSPRRRDSFPFT